MAELQYKFTSDIMFKMLFTQHEALLRDLVAAALCVTPADIKTLMIKNPEILPEEIGNKFCRLDLNMDVNGEPVDIEIQVSDEGNFKERSLYYWTRLFSTSLEAGEDYMLAPRTILISIIDFNLFECEEFYSEFAALEKTRHELLTDRMEILFFELKKLPDSIDRNDRMQIWLKLISAKTEDDLAAIESMEVKEMAQAVNAYKQISATQKYQELERIRDKARHDEAQALNNAMRHGEIKGRKKTQEETARRLLAMGLSIDDIIVATELSREEIEALKN